MIARIQPSVLRGSIPSIPSKSDAHRILICAALADGETHIGLNQTSQDIEATVRCLSTMGAEIARDGEILRVKRGSAAEICEADCGESGSTLRFLLPVAAVLGAHVRFHMHGRLAQRPMDALIAALEHGGCIISRQAEEILEIFGMLRPGRYILPGSVSSQYVSGMLMALSCLQGESILEITGRPESVHYIEMTLNTLRRFGADIGQTEVGYRINGGGLRSPGEIAVEGDWSNAAFWLCAGAEVTGLDLGSLQGDKRVLREMKNIRSGSGVADAADIPDLVPALAAYACIVKKRLLVINGQRLRLKESDRIASVVRTVNALGGSAEETADGLIVRGGVPLRGGCADAENDHRIAMMAAILSAACTEEIALHGAEAVNKSYPGFWNDFIRLGGRAVLTED